MAFPFADQGAGKATIAEQRQDRFVIDRFLAPFGGGTGNTGDQVRGFGYSHDGSTDTLFRFVASPVFTFPSDVERRNVEAFMADLDPVVGQLLR